MGISINKTIWYRIHQKQPSNNRLLRNKPNKPKRNSNTKNKCTNNNKQQLKQQSLHLHAKRNIHLRLHNKRTNIPTNSNSKQHRQNSTNNRRSRKWQAIPIRSNAKGKWYKSKRSTTIQRQQSSTKLSTKYPNHRRWALQTSCWRFSRKSNISRIWHLKKSCNNRLLGSKSNKSRCSSNSKFKFWCKRKK